MPHFLGYIYYEATTNFQPLQGYINCESNRSQAGTKYGVDLVVKKGEFILNIYITYIIILLKFFLSRKR